MTSKIGSQISETINVSLVPSYPHINLDSVVVVFIGYFITLHFLMARTDSDDSRQEAILTLELSPEENEQVTSLSFIRFPDYHSPYQLLNMFLPPAPPCGQMLLLSSQFEIIPSSGKG